MNNQKVLPSSATKLFYVYDPMCSWCWGFKPIWQQIKQIFEGRIEIKLILGGLAPDNDQPLSEEMKTHLKADWRKVEWQLGTEFNHNFWEENTPYYSTYPSCRAVLAARKQNAELQMLAAIQNAFYIEARNPSRCEVLVELAEEIGLDVERFEDEYYSEALNKELFNEFDFACKLGGYQFPSLFIGNEEQTVEVKVDYQSPQKTIAQIEQLNRKSAGYM